MPEMLSPAILNKSMPSTAGATIGIPPARADSGAFQREVPSRDEERNLQCSGEVYQLRSGFSNGQWLCCSLLAPIAHPSP